MRMRMLPAAQLLAAKKAKEAEEKAKAEAAEAERLAQVATRHCMHACVGIGIGTGIA